MRQILVFILFFSTFPSYLYSETSTRVDQVKELKDRVLDKKLQLQLVRELIRRERLDTQYPALNFQFKNTMSSRYLLSSLDYYIDENKVFSFFNDIAKLGKADEANKKKIDEFAVNLSPGKHTIRVVAIYKGNDTGVFSYLSDYKVRSEGLLEIEVKRGQDMAVQVLGFEKGGLFTDFKERPSVEISVK